MEQKKKKRILIISIVSVILAILILGLIFIFVATDIFKSDKELFFKYGSQIFSKEDGFIEGNIVNYFEKQNSTPFQTKGNISVEVQNNSIENYLEHVNNFNITFSGNIDNNNSKTEQEISINYSDDVNFPLIYKQVGDIFGIQTKYIGSKYVAVKNDEQLQTVLSNLGVSNLSEGNFDNTTFNEEEFKNTIDTFSNIIYTQLQNLSYTKVTTSTSTGYKVTIDGQTLKNIIIGILSDENISNKIVGVNDTIQIEDLVEQINNNTNLEQYNLDVVVYQSDGKVIGIMLQLNEQVKVEIIKNNNLDEVQYNMTITTYEETIETAKIYLNVKFTGLQSAEVVDEYYELGFEFLNGTLEQNDEAAVAEEEKSSYKYMYSNNITFTDTVEIEDLTEENSMILNEQSEEYVTNLSSAISERLKQVNKTHMENLGLSENENPILYLLPTFGINSNEGFAENIPEELDEIKIAEFNAKFELYASSNSQGATTKGLLSTVLLNNTSGDNSSPKIEEINFDGQEYEVTEQSITLIKSSINVEDGYKIEFEKNPDTGIIYRIVINKI